MSMRRGDVAVVATALTVLLTVAGCSQPQAAPTAAAAPEMPAKIPVTTASEEARQAYLEGRSLVERLLIQKSIERFDAAIAADPSFALAELARANASPTGSEFLAHLKKAVALADKVSSGERLQILAADAGSSGNAAKARGHLEQLVAAYPQDERAHFALGAFLFGQQEPQAAIEHFKAATRLDPNYSAPYNQMGYAYRQVGDYDSAEKAFKKYIELIPNDPNPYDSYGELLLKMGRFDESIAQYRKALAIDDHFLASHLGISADLMYSGKPADAAAEMQQIADKARNDGERRTALFAMTSLAIYSGRMDEALALFDKQYALGEKTSDTLNLVGDLQGKAAVLIEMGKGAQAQALLDQAQTIAQGSSLPDAIKANIALFHHNNAARASVASNDLAGAKKSAELFVKTALASGNGFQVKQAHELAGIIALKEKNWDAALAELDQASQQNAYNHYRMCLAYQGKGDAASAAEHCGVAAHFNPLPELNFSFIHAKAAKLASAKS
jgi:tetratricopeptide (TPR) repeat protein